jgi:DNA-binding response OmpR family regulator
MPRLLLIDDNDHIRRLGRAALEGAGFDVDEAADGAAGLRLHRAARYDLVVCDLFMPDRDGLETLQELRGSGDPVPVVAISGGTALGPWDWLGVATRFGSTSTLRKPFKPRDLVDAVQAALVEAAGSPPPREK